MKKFLLMVLLVGCSHAPSPVQPARNEWDHFTDQVLDQQFAANPEMGAYLGRHEFDGQLQDYSLAALHKETERLQAVRERMVSFPDYKLDSRQKFERKYMLAALDGRLFWLTKTDEATTDPGFYAGNLDPAFYVVFNYAPAKDRLRAFIKYAQAVPKALEQIKANLRAPVPLPLLNQGQLMYQGLGSYVANDVPKVFATVDDPGLQQELKTASQNASDAFLSFSKWLEAQRAAAPKSFSLGAEKLHQMLMATEQVDSPLADIEAAGRADLEHNLANLKTACAKYAPKLSLKACVHKEESVKPTEAMVVVARRQLAELKTFIRTHEIMTIPSEEEALVDVSPPYMRWNTAFISIPGIFEKSLPSTYYLSPPDPKWTPAAQKAYLRSEPHLMIISAHEVWPGHFMDGLHNRKLKPSSAIFGTYAASEGWAHYCEEMMVDAGLRDGDPALRIGQALEALLRDVRLLSSIGLHTGKMTQAQSEKMFLDKAFADPGTAKQQAARGVFDPGYLNYTLGKLMIRRLREDWTASRGGVKAWKAFHDAYLSYGDAPIPMIREAMMGGGTLF